MRRNPSYKTTAEELKDIFLTFSKRRGWEEKYFPNQLAKALVVEAAEVLEIFQRMDDVESTKMVQIKKVKQKISDEAVDVLYYLLMLTHVAKIDINEAVIEKLKKLEKRYPPKD